MQPESSMDPGEISIQKLKEACEMVTITKQRHIFLSETKRTLKRGFTSSKVRSSGLRPEPTTLAALPTWIAKESLCLKNDPALFS